jgi:hypothetical protein
LTSLRRNMIRLHQGKRVKRSRVAHFTCYKLALRKLSVQAVDLRCWWEPTGSRHNGQFEYDY